MRLIYPAKVRKDGDGYTVRIPDVPEALTTAMPPPKVMHVPGSEARQ